MQAWSFLAMFCLLISMSAVRAEEATGQPANSEVSELSGNTLSENKP